jgi:MYXO-CTERM domain-containing protein
VPVRVEPIDVQTMVDQSYATMYAHNLELGKLNVFSPWFNSVQTLEAINSKLEELAAASNGRARVMAIGRSIQGRDIKAMRISSAPDQGDRASVLITGTHHAREWISPMVTMGFIEALITQYGQDPAVDKIVNNLDTYIIPVLNPDGYALTHAGTRLQRKNLRPNCNVDLNRNWDMHWGIGVPQNCSAETFPGQAAFSEPETQAGKALAESIKKLRFYIDYHSNANQIMIPYAYTQMPAPDVAKTRARGQLYSQKLQALYGHALPVRDGYNLGQGQGGGALDFIRAEYSEAICVELRGNGFEVPSDGVIPSVEENWAGYLAVMSQLADENPASGAPPADAGPPPSRDAAAPDAGGGDAGGRPDAVSSSGGTSGGAGGSAGAGAGTAGARGGGAGGAAGSGPVGNPGADAGLDRAPGAGIQGGSGGCSCEVAAPSPSGLGALLIAVALLALRVRKRSSPQ